MIRADGSDDGIVVAVDPADNRVAMSGITIDEDGRARVQRGGLTFQVEAMRTLFGQPPYGVPEWRTPGCTAECSQQGSGSVYHYEEMELSNGDAIDISYRVAPNQSRQMMATDQLHPYLRRIMEFAVGLGEDNLADREMVQRRRLT